MGRSKSISDYIELGRQKGIDFISPTAPGSVRHTVKWRCPRCKRVRNASYFAVQQRENGCRCQNKRSLDPEDYNALAQQLGIQWVAKNFPRNNKQLTEWVGPSEEVVLVSYHSLAYKGPSKEVCERLGLDYVENTQ